MWLLYLHIWDNQITRAVLRGVSASQCTNFDKSDNEGKVKGITILVTESQSNITYLIYDIKYL